MMEFDNKKGIQTILVFMLNLPEVGVAQKVA